MAAPSWFPGHMRRATLELRRLLKQVDLVLEVRDARVSEPWKQTRAAEPSGAALSGALHCEPRH